MARVLRARRKSFAEKRDEFSKSKLAMTLDYIFGSSTSHPLAKVDLDFQYSRRTGRLKYVFLKTGEPILTLRPNGSIAPSIRGYLLLLSGKKLASIKKRPMWTVTVIDAVSAIVSEGRTVFCKHVAYCNEELRAGQDVAILNQKGELLAAGRTVIPGPLIKRFKRGVAVKVREGRNKKIARDESRQPADPPHA